MLKLAGDVGLGGGIELCLVDPAGCAGAEKRAMSVPRGIALKVAPGATLKIGKLQKRRGDDLGGS